MLRFPFDSNSRLWGVAVSHYQVEGNDHCDWTEWESEGRTREACGEGVDSWARYEQDAHLAKEAGANSFRFSLSWSRIEPERGRFDDAALDRYARFVRHLRKIELEPVVTLFHYTHPTWFHEETPWHSRMAGETFARFASRAGHALGTDVRLYTIFNEPLVFLLAGYIDAQIPPAISDLEKARAAMEQLYCAHALSAEALRRVHADVSIGVAHNMMAFAPDRWWHPLDRLLAAAAHRFYNVEFLRAFMTGRWSMFLPPGSWFIGSTPGLAGSLDFIGVNFYSRLHMRCPGRERPFGDFNYLDRSGRGLTDLGWEIVPSELARLCRVASRFGLPIIVTENGIADASDQRRATYLEDHIDQLEQAAISKLSGYFHWSLLDNFEWLEGYTPRFGLYAVDRDTMQRSPRASIETFRRLGARFSRGT